MAYTRLPSRYQFESSSGSLEYSQKYNCNPTVLTAIAQYYRDTWLGIEATRTQAGVPRGRPTTYNEGVVMLTKRGVRCQLRRIESLAELQSLVRSGRRPIAIGVRMSRVPASVRGHSFLDWHMIGVRGVVTNDAGAEIGFDIMDPNFSPPGGPRPDPTGGHRYYTNSVMNYAFIQDERKLAIVPDALKSLPAPPPPPPPPPPPTAGYVADGDPYPMRMRTLVNPNTGQVKLLRIKGGKPYRRGALVGHAVAKKAPSTGEPIVAVSYIDKDDLPSSERVFGNVWVVPSYLTNGDHFFYVKEVDTTTR